MGAVALLTVGTIIVLRDAFAATTYYVDATCPTAGNGTSATCSSGVTTNNPKKLLSDGIALLTTAGDVLNVRGIHAAHNTGGENCPGDTEGRYYSDQFTLTTNITGAGATIQPYGYTGVGTGETVYIDGTMYPTNGWTQCTDCSAGSAQIHCQNVPGTCGDAYYTIEPDSGTAQRAIGAQKRDGTPTYRVLDPSLCTGAGTPQACCTGAGTGCGLANLTNSHAGYTGTSPEIDSTSPQIRNAECLAAGNPSPCCTGAGTGACNWITVKWGSQTPGNTIGNRSYIFHDNNAVGFQFNSNVGGYTIRGLNVRAHRRQGFGIAGGTGNNITITDNHILYNIDRYGGGSDYGVGLYLSTGVTISGNEFGWMGSEAIHEQGKVGGVSANTISDNWIHDSGDRNVLGQAACGTPSGMILTDDGTGGLSDYTGSVTSGNLIVNMNDHSPICSTGRGIILENNTKNMVVRDNVIKSTAAEGIKIDPNLSGHGDGHQIFNNLIISNGGGGNGNAFWIAPQGAGGTANNNLIWNNTCINPASGCLGDNGVGTITGNVFANNTFFSTSSQQLVDWHTGGTFSNNDVKSTTSGTLVAFNGSNYTCSSIGTLGSGNVCKDPLFTNAANNDYHIQTTSPLKDAGISSGMPSARTRDINNTVAGAHSFPSYADGQVQAGSAWDIGVDEFSTGGTVTLTISKTDSPDPVVAGNNITYTLAYSNTSGTSATGVTIVDPVPANTTFVSATAGGALGGGNVTWNIGTVLAGGAGTVQMVVRVTSPLANGTVITNSAYSITSNETASIIGVADTTTVTSAPFLVLGKADSPDPVLAGSNITYTITYSNTGTAGATGVVITDTVPVNTTFVSATSGGIQSGGVVTWTIGPVNAGALATVQMVVQVGAGVANGSTITNATYSMASNELSTINGAAVTTSVFTSSPTTPNFILPITQRQNTWSDRQTHAGGPSADLVQTANGGQWIRGQASEEITLSTSGTTTDSVANLLPSSAIIEAIVARVTQTITVATDWKVGDGTQAARFCSANATLAAGTTSVCLNQDDPTVATANLGPVQSSAAKVRITTTGTPGAGKIRITVFYRQFIPPGS